LLLRSTIDGDQETDRESMELATFAKQEDKEGDKLDMNKNAPSSKQGKTLINNIIHRRLCLKRRTTSILFGGSTPTSQSRSRL